tara:strand:- start:849 stop:1304 length:456 start_codon:yes stop_codon:yes gene_type:complete
MTKDFVRKKYKNLSIGPDKVLDVLAAIYAPIPLKAITLRVESKDPDVFYQNDFTMKEDTKPHFTQELEDLLKLEPSQIEIDARVNSVLYRGGESTITSDEKEQFGKLEQYSTQADIGYSVEEKSSYVTITSGSAAAVLRVKQRINDVLVKK